MYQTSEGGDWIFSNMVYFEIIKNGLLIPYISTEKSEYVVGDKINISWSPSPADSQLSHYWLVITSPDGKEIVGETMNLNTSFSFTVEQIGNYTIKTFATLFNSKEGEGSLTDTKTISVIAISTTSKTTTTTTSTTTTTTPTTTTLSTITSTTTTTSTTTSTTTTATTEPYFILGEHHCLFFGVPISFNGCAESVFCHFRKEPKACTEARLYVQTHHKRKADCLSF